ncbi:MAG TPA: NAD(P)-binding domain-containing protein [Polyangiaceae bacterium]|nr:NAD(P)-binding domain-containing protein [Polyangiaceae bacterium]
MKIGVLGTGMVGQTIGQKLIELGHEVKLGSRTASNEKGSAWAAKAGARASHGTFAASAGFGELLFNCTPGEASLEVLAAAGDANLRDKVLIDVSNPLDFSKGMPPTLFVGNDDSLGERIQRAHPELKVVKTLNTVNCEVMVDAARVASGDHTMFLCGNDASAKATVRALLIGAFGWRDVIDLGDISNARATEALLPIWIRLWGVLKTGDFNLKVVR